MTDVECGCYCAPKPLPKPLTGFTPYRGAATRVRTAGQSVIALYGPMAGGRITNPPTAVEQGIVTLSDQASDEMLAEVGPLNTYAFNRRPALNGIINGLRHVVRSVPGPPEILYVSLVGPAALTENGTTRALLPGKTFKVPRNFNGNVWVNAASNGHQFTAITLQPVTQHPPAPVAVDFPPAVVTTKSDTIPSYLFEDFFDDDDLQAFVASYNARTQEYVNLLNSVNLPIYTTKSTALLDWVGSNLYGIDRPTLFSGKRREIGPFNTYGMNTRPVLNATKRLAQFNNVAVTTDDVYKRILTWHLYKGDGRQVTTRWLKRRIARFLWGTDGREYRGTTRQISVTYGLSMVSITIISGRSRVVGGSIFNKTGFNTNGLNQIKRKLTTYTIPALAAILVEAIETGALETPSQYTFNCRVGIVGA